MKGLDKLTTDDRFELLSAYLDDELSLSEREQVEAWLESDTEIKRQYQALSSLSCSFKSLPSPQASTSADEMLEAVFSKVERKPSILKITAIGAACAAAIGAVGAVFSGTTFSPQMANQDTPSVSQVVTKKPSERASSPKTVLSTDIISTDLKSMDTDSLMLVLEAPPVDIPIVADGTLTESGNF